MSRERYASVSEIKPNYEGLDEYGARRRYLGYVALIDGTGEKHFFYHGSIDSPLRKFPELKQGDTVKMHYERGGSYALWFVKEIVND
jgi:hypothetical protein